MYRKGDKTISIEEATSTAEAIGMSIEEWANKYGWAAEGKQEGSTEVTPTEEPLPTPAGDSSSGDISLGSQDLSPVDKALSRLSQINISEEYLQLEENVNIPKKVAVKEMTPKGILMATGEFYDVYAYDNYMKPAREALGEKATDEQVRDKAKDMYLRSAKSDLFNAKVEEIMEDFDDEIYTPFGRLKKYMTQVMAGADLSEGAQQKALLQKEIEKSRQNANAEIDRLIKNKIAEEAYLETSAVTLNKIGKKYEKDPNSVSQQEVDEYKKLSKEYQEVYSSYTKTNEELTKTIETGQNLEELVDLTARSYDNLDIATGRVASAALNMSGNLLNFVREVSPDKIISRVTGEETSGYIPFYVPGIGVSINPELISTAGDALVKEAENITSKIEKRQELSKVKSAEDFLEFGLDLFTEQAVNTAVTASIPAAGLAVVAASASGEKFRTMQLEMDNGEKITPLQFYVTGVMYGAGEYITEKVALDQFLGARKSIKKSLDLSRTNISQSPTTTLKAIETWGLGINREGSAELGAQVISNFADRYVLDRKEVGLWDGIGEAYFSGAVMSGLGFGAPGLITDIYSAATTGNEAAAANRRSARIIEINNKINDLHANSDINDPGVQQAVNVLQEEADELIKQNLAAMKAAESRIDELSKADKRILLNIDSDIYKAKGAVDRINSNENLSKEEKIRLIEKHVDRISSLENRKEQIFANSEASKSKAKAKVFQMRTAAEKGLKFNYINGKDTDDAIEQALQEVEKADINEDAKEGLKSELLKVKEAAKKGEIDIYGFYAGAEYSFPIAITTDEGAMENRSVAAHEVAHATLFRKLLEGNSDIIGLAQDLRKYLEKTYGEIAVNKFKAVDAAYGKIETAKDSEKANIAEEIMAATVELSRRFDLKTNANKTLQGKLLGRWNSIFKNETDPTEIKTGKDVLAAIESFNASFDTGEIKGLTEKIFKGEVKARLADFKQQAKDRGVIKSMSGAAARAQVALDKMQAEGYDANSFELYEALNGMAGAQLNKYKVKGLQITDMEEAVADVVGRLYTERDVNKFDGRGSLYGYLNGRIKFRILDAFKANPIWVEDFGDVDAEGLTGKEVQKVAVEAVETTETPKAEEGYKNLLRRRVLEPEVVDAIKAKVMSTVRVMKTRMDESVSKNVTVKPYIAELRKAMGKQADIDLKKAMGGLKDGQLRKFLLKNKAAILENMTTTWLMTAMPNAVQKKVDGQWTSDWKGKKIDRETVATDSAGRTSGAELVRRLPKAATRMSDADFLSNFFNADGSLIRGRKESLAKAMAEEISFDIINEALQDPNSDIRKAFEMRQDLLGVELADNFVAEVSRDIERGNVKYSKTLRNMTASEQLAFENGRSEFTSRIEKLKGKFGNSPTVIRNELKAVYGDTFNNEQYKNIANDLFKILKSISQVEEIAEMWTGEEFDVVLGNMLDDIDFMENVNQLTGSEQTVAALYRNKEAVYQAREALIAQLYKIKPPVEVAKSFLAPTFANSGRIGAFLPNGDMKETTRQDLFFSVADVESEFVGEGKLYSREEWDNAGRYTVSAKVNVSHLNGKFDTDSELRRKDAEAAAAALQLTEDIVKGLKGQSPEMQAMILAAMNSGTNTALRLGAPVTHVSVGFKSTKPGDFRYEHATPARVVLSLMYKHYVQGDNSIDIDALKQDYKVAIIPKVMDEIITSVGLGPRQVVGYVPGKTPWWKRYYNIFTRGRVQFALKEYGSENLVGERYAEMYNRVSTFDAAEWAVAVEALEPQTKYSQSVPRAVFMVGGPGAGKTNVGKGLKLGRRGYKVINQDLALEPMKEEAGLPANEQEYTKEQRSMRAKLGAAARKAAEAKMEKYLGLRESMVVDGTGASYNATMKKINALREAGYEVSIVFANTSKDEAIARNKARAERALPDMIVERTWEAVQESAKLYKEEFGDKFYELNTNELKLGEDLPKPFLDKLYKDLEVGEAKYSKSVSKEFNEILERKTGVASYKEFSRIQAQLRGKKKGRFKFFIHPSADDFRGLVHYAFAGKGKQGEADIAWLEEKLLTPYFRGVAAIDAMRQQIKRDFKVVTKQFREEYKLLGKQVGNSGFTYDHALRVYMWDRQGMPIEGLAKRDKTLLLDAIAKNPELVELADALLVVSRRNEWPEPTEYWEGGSILGDLNGMTEKIGRKKFLAEFIENAEIIFSEENLNKIEALFGSAHREAIEDSLYSMKNGTNRRAGTSKQVGAWLNWVNGSTGAIMFFNRRSALLQMLSFTNFINWSDNNPAMAAAAFANQKEYWKDWAMIFNSDKLKERRGGLKQDVSDAELAAVANRSKNSPQAILAYLLKIGFTPTQIADSMAIATGGAMFYRNRVNTYLKQGMDQAAAEEQAFLDFAKKSDEAQQSSDPALVSQQQRSVLGRMILAFANTPMQYTRLMKKAGQDLINGRGNPLENISKIAYYGVIQNFIFSALQSAMFALLFDDDEEDDEKKAAEQEKRTVRTLNSMLDTVLRGSGIYGAVASTVKNTIMEFYRQEDKGFLADHTYTLLSALNLSPPIGSKARKLYSAIQTRKFEKDNIEQRGWSLTADGRLNIGPNYFILGNVLSGVTNVPMDRVADELNSITEALDARNKSWQRIALALGWKTWDVGARNEEADLIKAAGKEKRKQEGIEKAKETRKETKKRKDKAEAAEREKLRRMTPAQRAAYLRNKKK